MQIISVFKSGGNVLLTSTNEGSTKLVRLRYKNIDKVATRLLDMRCYAFRPMMCGGLGYVATKRG